MEEFKGLIQDDHLDWVAQYLVMKRASIEPNFHTLYINFMDTLTSAPLRKMVLRETYRNIKVQSMSRGTRIIYMYMYMYDALNLLYTLYTYTCICTKRV